MPLDFASVNYLDDYADIIPYGAAADQVTLLKVSKQDRFAATKTFTAAEKIAFTAGKFFQPVSVPVSCLEDLHAVLVDTCEGHFDKAFIVHGRPLVETCSCTRAKGGRGLRDSEHRWLYLDVDHLPNTAGVDPRKDPATAISWVRSLLPSILSEAKISYQWSSSCCWGAPDDQPPKELSVHLRVWLSRAAGEAIRRTIMRRVSISEPSIATYNAAIYVQRPGFQGIPDPLIGSLRYGLLDGKDEVDLDVLLAELPPLITETKWLTPEQKAARRAARKQAAKPRQESAQKTWVREAMAATREPIPADPFLLICEKINTRCEEIDGELIAPGRRTLRKNQDLCRARILLDLPRFVADMRETDPVWAAAGGVPDGQRNTFLMMCSSALSYLFPVGWVEEMTREFCAPLIEGGEAAINENWVRGGQHHVLRRALDDAADVAPLDYCGHKVESARYGYWRSTWIQNLGITEAQMIKLECCGLQTDAVRQYFRRRRKGQLTLADRRFQSAAHNRPWEQEGISRSTYYDRKRRDRKPGDKADGTIPKYGSPEFEEGLADAGLDQHSNTPLADRPEVQDVLAHLRLAKNPRDAEAFARIADRPGRGPAGETIGAHGVRHVTRLSRQYDTPLHEILTTTTTHGFCGPGSKIASAQLEWQLESLRHAYRSAEDSDRVIRWVLDEVGLAWWHAAQAQPSNSLKESFDSLIAIAQELPDIADFICQFPQRAMVQDEINKQGVLTQKKSWTPKDRDISIGVGVCWWHPSTLPRDPLLTLQTEDRPPDPPPQPLGNTDMWTDMEAYADPEVPW